MYLFTAYAERGPRRALGHALAGAGAAAALVAGLSGSAVASTGHQTRASKPSGDVDVLSAGSLNTLMTEKVGPAFHKATGYTLVDTSGGSSTLAADIKNKIDVADVFLSASPKVTQTLMGAKNGSWVSWYATFADSPYVLGYYPKSRFAKDLRTMPWYKVITMSGFKLGRTNPSQDPGGVLAVEDLKAAASKYKLPALTKIISNTSTEFEEDTEQADIQNGQLDASFMYEADANSQGSPFVKLSGVPTLYGDYTMSLVKNAPHTAAAEAFIKFMLSAKGKSLLTGQKFGVKSPATVTGSGVPAALKGVLK